MLAAIVRLDIDGIAVPFGGRFPVRPLQGRDAEGSAVLPVPAFGNNSGSRRFQFCGKSGQRGGAVALVAQLLGDVQEHVGFIHDDRFKLISGFLV
ncbi:hypothetical protein D9M72_457220 [compost metagenome]